MFGRSGVKYTIVLKHKDQYETWGALTDACKAHKQFSYPYLKSKNYPFYYKGFEFNRVEHKKKLIEDV